MDVHEGKTKIRRKGNKALPEMQERKRDAKAADKQEAAMAKQNKVPAEDEYDEDGKVILVEKDFDNPLIIAFKVEEIKEGDDFKSSWKEVEKSTREKFPKLKLIYARGDDRTGHLAFSNLRLKTE